MTTPPPESSTPLIAPTLAETRALNDSYSEDEIRALAQQLRKSGELGFDPTTLIKGTITAISYSSSPPTVSINVSGDTTTAIAGVRILNDYTPVVGQTVLVHKQGADIVVLGHIADVGGYSITSLGNGWIKATLSSGSHNGNSNGDICYRLILDHGSWKMQWRGGWNVSGTEMIGSGNALATQYRPKGLRSVTAGRTMSSGSSITWDFHTDGRVVMTGGNVSPNSSSVSGDVGYTSYGSSTGSVGSHSHAITGGSTGFAGSHSHGFSASHDHAFYGGSHSHSVSSPSWASLNGVEYFL